MKIPNEGDVLIDFASSLERGSQLVVMPVARTNMDSFVIKYPEEVTFYIHGCANLDSLNPKPYSSIRRDQAGIVSQSSGINVDTLYAHNLVVFPYTLDWESFLKNSFRDNIALILRLSEHVDRVCLDFVRYRLCGLSNDHDPIHCLPGRAGQIDSNHMMAGALLYHHSERRSFIIGGDPFTHIVTRGLGLPLDPIEQDEFPADGEIGRIARHALSLYSDMLEARTQTSMFVQGLALLEFLAFPDDYRSFKEVKKVIARYAAGSATEYTAILEKFHQWTGKTDETSKRPVGYRTRIVHMGERLEDIIPDAQRRRDLIVELDHYIRTMINDMVAHSECTRAEYSVYIDGFVKWKE